MGAGTPLKSQPESKEDFDDLTIKVIDETFSTLGEQSKTAIYAYLKKNYGIDKKEIPHRIDDFSVALEKLFKNGAGRIEVLLMKNLYARVSKTCGGFSCEWTTPEVTFQEYVQLMKQQFNKALTENKSRDA